MKVKTGMTDIPYAIEDARLLANFGYALSDKERGPGKGELSKRYVWEASMRMTWS
jgi:hypothetical protein